MSTTSPTPGPTSGAALRTLSEHVYSPVRLPLSHIDVLNTLMAPLVNVPWSLVIHMKTMHAFTAPEAVAPLARAYRRCGYPRSVQVAEAVIINSESLRSEIKQHLEVDDRKLKLIYEAVDHDLFRPGDLPQAARPRSRRTGSPSRSCCSCRHCGRTRTATACCGPGRWRAAELGDRQLAIVGPGRDEKYGPACTRWPLSSASPGDVVFVGGVPLEETVEFYRAADVFVYPSFNETFGLPILEAMACGCPVVTSDTSAMPETAGRAAVLADPNDPASIARAMWRRWARPGPAARRGPAPGGPVHLGRDGRGRRWTCTAR